MAIAERGMEAVLGQQLKTVLEKWCITNVAADDDSKADAVVLGKPTSELRDPIVISIHLQHPLGIGADKDTLAAGPPRARNERSWTFPAEIGGGSIWKIIGTVQVNIREREAYEDAIETIASVIERVRAAINQDASLVPLKDDFGNTVIVLETFQAEGYAGGGGEVSINFRWVDWRAFCHRTDCRRVVE